MVWDRVDDQRGPEVSEREVDDLATCRVLAETLVQLQQGQNFIPNLRACMGQRGYMLVEAH
jgi:hypothetical protein